MRKQRWLVLGLIISGLILLAVTVRWWLPRLLSFVGVHSDLIQGLTDLMQWPIWAGSALIAFFGWWRGRHGKEPSDVETVILGTGAMQVQGDVGGDLLGPGATKTEIHLPESSEEKLAQARQRYLIQLRRHCNALPLATLGGEESVDEDVTLDKVYVALNTTTPVPLTEEEKVERKERFSFGERAETRPLTALEATTQARRLVLLGDPGSGKSTFVRQLVSWLAGFHLSESKPPPGGMETLMPILITLRDLIFPLQQLDLDALPKDRQRTTLIRLVHEQVMADLARLGARRFAEGLAQALSEGRCLLVFDGLDEVPPVLRRGIRLAIQAVTGQYAPQWVIVTCRIRSYVGEATLPNFEAHTLAPFDDDKVRDFVTAWYRAQRDLGRVDAVQAEKKTADLQQAALVPELQELAHNPMLLTTMAIIHQREIGLPRERVRLYNLAVDILLSRWQKRKVGGADQAIAADLRNLLGEERKLRQIVERLAYEAHSLGRGEGEKTAADLDRGQALTLLESPTYLGEAGLAARFLDYVDQRAGLLVGYGGAEGHPSTYSFPHRTFQEYLAGCYVVGLRDVGRELWQRVREGDYWQLAAQLGAEEMLYNRRSDYGLLDVAYCLCPVGEPNEPYTWRATLWSGQMAVLLGRPVIEADCGPDYLARLLPRLVRLIEGNHLDAHERAASGDVLARLGDPRPGVGVRADGLPDVVWCQVPGGPFLMGTPKEEISVLLERFGGERGWYEDETPQHEVILPAYRIGRYPVTVAQFQAFVAAGGYREARYWPEAQAAGVWQAGRVKGRWDEVYRDGPADYGEPYNLGNHPVVGVTWYEALAYCRWLTERLREASGVRGEEEVTLPSEAQWEKAARGRDGRQYPWGNEADTNRANYSDTGLGATSAVGCFPGGVSPYGCLDVSGNVWEWCRTKWQGSYKDYHDDNDLEGETLRVLRGGAFYVVSRYARCAFRNDDYPVNRDGNLGFRVVVAPGFTSDL